MVALKEKSAGIILWAPWMSMKKFHGNLSCVCWDISVWTNWQINVVMPRAEPPSVVKKKTKNTSERSDGHMFLISDLSVPSRTCINTNKCTRQSGLVHVQKENVRQNTEEEPQISQPGPHQHEYKKKIRSQRWFQRIPKTPGISCRVGPIPWNRTSQCRKKKKQVEIQRSGFNQKLKPENVSWKNIFSGNMSGRESVPWDQNKLGGQAWPQVRQSTRSVCCESLGLWRLSRVRRTSLKQ